MSDDEDYMSSAFLEVKEDIRPGLLPKSVKRKLDIEQKRVESNKVFRTKSRKELEEESRSIGLNSAIGSDNKGFALLQKMGYKPGMRLGRERGGASGLTEPIRIEVKANRRGLGREDEIRRRIEQREQRRQKTRVYRERETEALTQEFRERMRGKADDRRLAADLSKCQKTCEQLDVESGVAEPMRPWFWYSSSLEGEREEEDAGEEEEYDEQEEEDLSPEEKIDFITEYVRPKYFYCSWCCIRYENEEDMNTNCPGPDKSCHDDLYD